MTLVRRIAAANFVLAICLAPFASAESAGQTKSSDSIGATSRYAFHSNFWVNAHHFLYETATRAQDSDSESVIGEPLLERMTPDERARFGECVRFYADHVIDKDLLFNRQMFDLKRWSIECTQDLPLPAGDVDSSLVAVLNQFRSVYARHFWEEHDRKNRERLAQHIDLLRVVESEASRKLSELTGTAWPDLPIRVDVATYASWAGAYTTTRPVPHVVISSSRPATPYGDWVESLVHEASHVLIGRRRGDVAEAIQKASAKLEREPPRNLWHAILFYLAGRVVQQLFEQEGIDYELYMVREDVFMDNYAHLKRELDPYIAGATDLDSAVEAILRSTQP